ncbi:uncharacterized protein RhaS with RHS repeats [Treponema pedis]
MVYNYKRYYSQETGAYISQDPIGLAGGNPTIYGYVKNPNAWVDVFGLACEYGKDDGKKLEDDIEKILLKNNIPYVRNKKIGIAGELDFETNNHIIEATVSNGGKLKQIRKYKTAEFNPDNKDIILVGPNYKNSSAVKDIQNEGATVINSVDELTKIIK